MKILISGGSGRVGRYVVRELAALHQVTVLDAAPVPEQIRNADFVQGDVLSLTDMVEKLAGYDAVVHLAGIPGVYFGTAEDIFRVNTLGTFNVLEACVQNSIGNFVLASSDSTFGFVFQTHRHAPDYLPLDENHPTIPQDAYGLSKVVCEEICRTYARRYGIKTTSLRPCWVWTEEEREMQKRLVDDPSDWWKMMWAYVDARDCARAFRLAVESEDKWEHEAFLITADDNGTKVESRELIAHYYPEVTQIADDFGGHDSLLSSAKAKQMLGYASQYRWRHFL